MSDIDPAAMDAAVAAVVETHLMAMHEAGVVIHPDLITGDRTRRLIAKQVRPIVEATAQHFACRCADSFWTPAEWEEWSNEVAIELPEEYDGDAAQESLILKAVKDLVRERATLQAKVERVEAEVALYREMRARNDDVKFGSDATLNAIEAALAEDDA